MIIEVDSLIDLILINECFYAIWTINQSSETIQKLTKKFKYMIIKIEYNSEILQLNSKFHSVGPLF